MYVKKTPFIIPLTTKAVTGSSFNIVTPKWAKGDVVVIDTIAIFINANSPRNVHVGIIQDETAFYAYTIRLTSNGRYFATDTPFVIPSEYQLIVTCISPVVGTNYKVTIFGHMEEYKEG